MTNISYVENKAPYFQKFNEIEINNDPKYTDLHKVQTVRLWQWQDMKVIPATIILNEKNGSKVQLWMMRRPG